VSVVIVALGRSGGSWRTSAVAPWSHTPNARSTPPSASRTRTDTGTSADPDPALGLALLVSVALRGTTGGTEAFHRSALGAAIFAAATALVAIALLSPAQSSAAGGQGEAS
jgi:hypothetical protein